MGSRRYSRSDGEFDISLEISNSLLFLEDKYNIVERIQTLNFLLIGRFCLQAVTVYELYNSEKVTKPPFGSFFLSEKFGIIVVHSP